MIDTLLALAHSDSVDAKHEFRARAIPSLERIVRREFQRGTSKSTLGRLLQEEQELMGDSVTTEAVVRRVAKRVADCIIVASGDAKSCKYDTTNALHSCYSTDVRQLNTVTFGDQRAGQ